MFACTLTIHGETFVQAQLVVIVRVFRRANLTVGSPSCAHSAATVRLRHRLQIGSSCCASATDRLQETVTHPTI